MSSRITQMIDILDGLSDEVDGYKTKIKQLEERLSKLFKAYDNLEIIEGNVNAMTLCDLFDEIDAQKALKK